MRTSFWKQSLSPLIELQYRCGKVLGNAGRHQNSMDRFSASVFGCPMVTTFTFGIIFVDDWRPVLFDYHAAKVLTLPYRFFSHAIPKLTWARLRHLPLF